MSYLETANIKLSTHACYCYYLNIIVHLYVKLLFVKNLAWVKSFNICLELEDNQEIFCELFKLMFGIVK